MDEPETKTNWHDLLNHRGVEDIKEWIFQNIDPWGIRALPETQKGSHLNYLYETIQILIQSLVSKILILMSSKTLDSEPVAWVLLNNLVERITVGDNVHKESVNLYYDLLSYCQSCCQLPVLDKPAEPMPAQQEPKPKRKRLDFAESLEENGLDLLDGLVVSPEVEEFVDTFLGIAFERYVRLQAEVQDAAAKLGKWKRNEEFKDVDFTQVQPEIDETYLDSVQEVYEHILDSISFLSDQEAKAILLSMAPNLLVITNQPACPNESRVLFRKFDSTVRLLLGRHLRDLNYIVRAEILDQESQPVSLTLDGQSFSLEQNTSELKLQPETKTTAEFSARCKKIPKRLTNIKSVFEENLWIRFHVELQFERFHESLVASVDSLPVKFVVNVSQHLQAWEMVIWDNAARNFGINPVSSRPIKLPYESIICAINTRIFQVTGRPLLEQDFTVIGEKILGESFFNPTEQGQAKYISLEEFTAKTAFGDLELDLAANNEEKKKKISFWGWFFHLSKFIKDNLQFEDFGLRKQANNDIVHSLWSDSKGYIMGYIPKERAETILSNCKEGTFILRLSITTPNAISLDWIDEDGIHSYRANSKDLKIRSLPDCIMDIENWKFLYILFSKDNIPKESVFIRMPSGECLHQSHPPDADSSCMETPRMATKNAIGYVRALLQLKLLAISPKAACSAH